MWTKEEIQAVEQKLMNNIKTGKVPGKSKCLDCIRAFPEALRGRTWDAAKYYVKNRMDTWNGTLRGNPSVKCIQKYMLKLCSCSP